MRILGVPEKGKAFSIPSSLLLHFPSGFGWTLEVNLTNFVYKAAFADRL